MNHLTIERQQAKDYDIEVHWHENGQMEKKHIPVEKRDEATKCHRCYQYGVASASNYNLCSRCQRVMHLEYNHLCVACGCEDANDNLCDDCRQRRITEFDSRYITRLP